MPEEETRPVPERATEVGVTKDMIDKLDVYAGLGTGEVWRYEDGACTLLELGGAGCEPISASKVLPEIDLNLLASFVQRPDQHEALKEYRDLVRNP